MLEVVRTKTFSAFLFYTVVVSLYTAVKYADVLALLMSALFALMFVKRKTWDRGFIFAVSAVVPYIATMYYATIGRMDVALLMLGSVELYTIAIAIHADAENVEK